MKDVDFLKKLGMIIKMDHLKESQESQFEEIDLLDFMRIIKKRKKIIFGLFLIGLLSGIIWYFLAPTTYKGTIILKAGGFDGITKKNIDYLENINEIAEKLKRGAYGYYPKLEVVIPQNTDLIEINLATKDRDTTREFLEKIKTEILSAHAKKADSKKQAIDQEISFLENKIEDLKKDISYFIAKGEQVALFKLEIYNIEKLIDDLEREKNNILMTEIVKAEITEERPGYLNVLFAATLGLFVGLILISFADWLEKNKKRI